VHFDGDSAFTPLCKASLCLLPSDITYHTLLSNWIHNKLMSSNIVSLVIMYNDAVC
jgi:hypothetical protein